MIWQDVVMGGCSVLFVWAMLPQVLLGFRERRGYASVATSVTTGTALWVTAGCLATLGAPATAVVNVMCGFLWFVLAAQNVAYGAPWKERQHGRD